MINISQYYILTSANTKYNFIVSKKLYLVSEGWKIMMLRSLMDIESITNEILKEIYSYKYTSSIYTSFVETMGYPVFKHYKYSTMIKQDMVISSHLNTCKKNFII